MEEDTAINDQPPEHDRPPRSKARLAFTIILLLVLVVLIIGIFTPVHDVVINHFLATAPTPTATLIAGDDLINISATPTGTVSIDGHTIKSSNPDGSAGLYYTAKPIRLSRGQHKIVWQAPPFQPLTCIISVPPLSNEPCNYESTSSDPNAPGERDISFSATLADLPPSQQAALKQAVQDALNHIQATDTIQPGEQYASPSGSTPVASPFGQILVQTATQTLNATLNLHLDTNPASQNTCQSGYGDNCTVNGQDCHLFCPNPFYGGPPAKGVQLAWDISGLFYATWTYTTQSGKVVAQNQPDVTASPGNQDHSINLRVTWDGTQWHASPDVPPESVSQFDVPPVCASVSNQITSTVQYGATKSGTNVTWGYAVGTNEAQGCLAIVVPSPGTPATPIVFKQPAAYFLYRFGVLLAVNSLAHSEFPNFPMADANEQAIAQSIAAKLKY